MKKVLLVLQMIPALLGIVKSVEEILPEGGQGAEKLGLIRSVMSELYGDISSIWPSLESVIGVIVSWFNRMGIFNKDEEPVA